MEVGERLSNGTTTAKTASPSMIRKCDFSASHALKQSGSEGRANIEALWWAGKSRLGVVTSWICARSGDCERGELMSKARGSRRARRDCCLAPGRASRCWCPASTRRLAIAKVVADFRAALPHATIYVYDNNSSDRTVEVARAAGAVVRRELRQGKGNVVRRMFADVDADIYVLVDGDATYDAPSARAHDRAADRRPARHGGRGARRSGARRPIAAAIAPATGCSPRSSPTCSAPRSPTSCRAIACSRAGS